MNRKERLSEFNRNNILTAAKTLFQTKGLVETTMDDIAKEADYSKSTVYVYFKSKDDIYNHIIMEHFELLKTAVSDALSCEPGFPGGYFSVCNALKRFNVEYPLFFESILGEIKIPDNETEPDAVLLKIYDAGEEINKVITEYLTNCINNGEIKLDIPPVRATFVLWAGITGVIMMAQKKEAYLKTGLGVTADEFMNEGFNLLLKTIQVR